MEDTIYAGATPKGYGGIGIVRVSGPQVPSIAMAVIGRCPTPRRATFCDFSDSDDTVIDSGVALYFEAPKSFTGEHVLELQGHGGIAVQELLCERVAKLGARAAEPGEFTLRAFLNDRIDLAQAESVADLINATTHAAVKASARSLTGEFSQAVSDIDSAVMRARTIMEAAIDFTDHINGEFDDSVLAQLETIQHQLARLLTQVRQGAMLRQGLEVVIAGAPNVGKSSLLNALLNEDRAIVTELAGTTRDTLSGIIQIDGVPINLTDTAGLHPSDDLVESAGIARAREAIAKADVVLWVTEDETPDLPPDEVISPIVVLNKCDLTDRAAAEIDARTVRISAINRQGLVALRKVIRDSTGISAADGVFAGRPRHIRSLQQAQKSLERAIKECKQKHGELVAEELRETHRCLGEIVGETTTEDLLSSIFSEFCIGK